MAQTIIEREDELPKVIRRLQRELMVGPLWAKDEQIRPDLERVLREEFLSQAKTPLIVPEPFLKFIGCLDGLPIIVAIWAAKNEIAPALGGPLLPNVIDIPGEWQAGTLQLDHNQRQCPIGVGMDNKPIDIATNGEFGKNPEVIG